MPKRHLWLLLAFFFFATAQSSVAEQRFIVRSNLGLPGLQSLCLIHTCTVVRNLDGTVNQLFLVTVPDFIDSNLFLITLRLLPGIIDAEVDQLLNITSGLATIASAPPELLETTPVPYYGVQVWSGYANQPAAQIVRVSDAQTHFGVTGTGIIADIDTGVDPNHPVLYPVLLAGYDFTRNHPGGSELNDLPVGTPVTEAPCPYCSPGRVNQYSIAMVDQYSIAMVDGQPYAAFGHGTMVAGVLHLVAPTSSILPLKAFRPDGTGYLSDILRAFYYAVQNQANVINMSFDFTAPSQEMVSAISYAYQNSVTCVASAGNDGQQIITYPASITNVMGVASTSDLDTRSTFSNYGSEVWVAAPGENIVTTYPFGSYSAASGTSFSAPFVSGGVALLLAHSPGIGQSGTSQAIAHAKPLTPNLGNGRLDLYQALGSLP
jgi:subtilisin family serine protease